MYQELPGLMAYQPQIFGKHCDHNDTALGTWLLFFSYHDNARASRKCKWQGAVSIPYAARVEESLHDREGGA